MKLLKLDEELTKHSNALVNNVQIIKRDQLLDTCNPIQDKKYLE